MIGIFKTSSCCLLVIILQGAGCATEGQQWTRDTIEADEAGVDMEIPVEASPPDSDASGQEGRADPDGEEGSAPDAPAGCGNGSLEGSEECDDGNTIPGDGCEPDCSFSCAGSLDCEDADPCRDWACVEGGTGRICQAGFTTASCNDGQPCTAPDRCDGAGRCSGAPVTCTVPPPGECADSANLKVYDATGTCDGSSGLAVCSYGFTLRPCEFGCQDGACLDSPRRDLHIDIYVDNFCNMNVVPPEVSVSSGNTAVLSYHNNSVDYPVDVWLSYGGGYLDLATGAIWDDMFEWCTGSSVYTGYADISTACSSHRLMIRCL